MIYSSHTIVLDFRMENTTENVRLLMNDVGDIAEDYNLKEDSVGIAVGTDDRWQFGALYEGDSSTAEQIELLIKNEISPIIH